MNAQAQSVIAASGEVFPMEPVFQARRENIAPDLLKDLRWRLDDIRDMLMKRDANYVAIYRLDEWSTPIVNLQLAIEKIDSATLVKEGASA